MGILSDSFMALILIWGAVVIALGCTAGYTVDRYLFKQRGAR
jgi:hypothetical protein